MTAAVLALVIRLLPDREWGRAMQAELASVDGGRARLRFALGCARAVLTSAGSRRRVGGLCVVGAVLALLLTGGGGPHGGGRWFVTAVLVVCAVAALRLTGRPEARRVALVAGTGGLVWWAAMLASATVRSHSAWALALTAICVVVAAVRDGEFAAIATAFATCLAIFLVAVGTYSALPRLAPDVAPANATDPLLENQIESTDPYVAELLLAALFGLTLIAAAGTLKPKSLPG
jgi:hypothetical protein